MSDYLTDEEQVDRLKRLWREWGTVVVVAIALGVGGTVGMDYYESYQISEDQRAADLYSSYTEAKTLGEPRTVFVEELADEFGSSSYYVFTLLHEAKAAVDSADFETALKHLEIAKEVSEDTPISDLVKMRQARVEFELEKYDAALATLANVETDGFRWQALMLKGDVHFVRDELDDARDAYQSAKDVLPTGVDSSGVDMRVASVPAAE